MSDDASCAELMEPRAHGMSIVATGAWPREQGVISHRGWAVVERSTRDDLVLYSLPNTPADVELANTEAGAAHIRVTWSRAAPILPIGARLWLELASDEDDGTGAPRLHAGTQLTLRVEEHGTLLLSGFRSPGTVEDGLRSDALTLQAPEALCSSYLVPCILGGSSTAYSLETDSDVPVRVSPGERARILLGGSAHDLWLDHAIQTLGTPIPMFCHIKLKDERLWVTAEIRTQEVDRVSSQLTQGTLPTCKLGNDPGQGIVHDVRYMRTIVLETKARYRGRSEVGGLLFDWGDPVEGKTTELQHWPTGPGAPSIPEPGQSFWMVSSLEHFVLRASRTGPIVLASGTFYAHDGLVDAASVALVSEWLGIPLAVEPDCLYESASTDLDSEPSYLMRMQFGGPEVVSVASGTTHRISLGDLPYDVWATTAREDPRDDSTRVRYTITRAD